MIEDYYQILEINRDCTQQDIAKAFFYIYFRFRRLSLRYHTKIVKQDNQANAILFSKIAEAYEVLSDPIKKAFVDRYGQDKLQEGFFEQGEIKGGYRFANNAEEIYNKFFLENNPFTKIYSNQCTQEPGSLFSHAFGAQNYVKQQENQNLEVNVKCTLKELYQGCSKEVTYKCSILNNDGRTTQERELKNTLFIKKGFKNGHTLTFKGKGHQQAGQENSDLIFKIEEVESHEFKRQGDDLHFTKKIGLVNALNCDPIEIVTSYLLQICLDNRILTISIDQIVTPQYVKVLKGEGMPVYNHQDGKTHGDLYIHFDIEFPKTLSQSQQNEIKKLLKN